MTGGGNKGSSMMDVRSSSDANVQRTGVACLLRFGEFLLRVSTRLYSSETDTGPCVAAEDSSRTIADVKELLPPEVVVSNPHAAINSVTLPAGGLRDIAVFAEWHVSYSRRTSELDSSRRVWMPLEGI